MDVNSTKATAKKDVPKSGASDPSISSGTTGSGMKGAPGSPQAQSSSVSGNMSGHGNAMLTGTP